MEEPTEQDTEVEISLKSEEPEDEAEPDDGVPRVLVTGASGFIASHLTKFLDGTIKSSRPVQMLGQSNVSS